MSILGVHRRGALSLPTFAAVSVMATTVAQTQSKNAATGKASGSHKTVLYTGIGPVLTLYDLDADAATLTKRCSVTLPGSVTEAAFHPSRKYVYVVWGNVHSGTVDHEHGITAFRIDPYSGALTPHGKPVSLPPGPGYVTSIATDIPGTHVFAAVNFPACLGVYQIEPDGTLGAEVKPAAPLDVGNHPHQVRMDPSNKTVILVTRGDPPTANDAENPGALKLFSYKDGMLSNTQTIAPNGGYNYQARHLDFHPSGKWDFLSLEKQQKLQVYERRSDGTLNPAALFTRDALSEPDNVRTGQILGTVRVSRTGEFVYLANRTIGYIDLDPKYRRFFTGGENNIVVFAINQSTGEPTLIQHIDSHGAHPRCIAFDPSGKILVAYNIQQNLLIEGGTERTLFLPNLAIFRVGGDGKLEFARKYDVDVGDEQDWMGITSLP